MNSVTSSRPPTADDHAGANRVGAERRADRALFEIGEVRRQRAGAQLQRQVLRFLRW